MMYRFLFVLLILLAGCTLPEATNTPPAATSTVAPTDTPTATLTETATASPSATWTDTPSITPSATNTPTASATITPSLTAQSATPTPTGDTINMFYPQTISVTPWQTDTAPRAIQCLLTYYDWYWFPGRIIVYRRDQAGYFECVKES